MKLFLFFFLLIWAPSVFAQDSVSNDKVSRTVIEGTFLQVSKLPPPKDNPYPDCYYTAIIDIAHIVSGQSIPKKIILVLPGFFSREYAPEAKYKVGDKVRATVVPFALMPDNVRQTQQADEIEDVDLEFYFPEKIAPVQEFQHVANPVPFTGKNQKTEGLTGFQPVDLKARAARQEAIRRDLEKINRLLAEHGGDWDKWYDSLKDFRESYKKQYDAKAQRWIGESFFSAGEIAHGKVYSPEFVKSVIAFKNYLAARNVDLILVRVPFKGEIVDDLFVPTPPDQISNPYLLRMYKELLEADVEIITDIIPRAKEARLKYPLMYWFQDFPEKHPAEGIAWVVAEALAKRLNRYEKIGNTPKTSFQIRQVSMATDSNNFLWPEGNPKFNPKEYVHLSAISTNDGKVPQQKLGLDSPVLMVGSSFIERPSLRLGGAIPAYLAYLTGIFPDIFFRSGSDASIPRTIAREGDAFMKNRSVCLFPMVPWAFYGSLDTQPIIDPTKSNKILLASYAGNDMQKQIQFASNTPEHVFSYSLEGSLTVQASDKMTRRGDGGTFSLILPQKISEFPFFVIAIESKPGDNAVFKAKYSTQTDTIHKSFSQTNTEDNLIFKTGANYVAEIHINNITKVSSTIIKSVKIYGLQQ